MKGERERSSGRPEGEIETKQREETEQQNDLHFLTHGLREGKNTIGIE